MCIWKTVLQKFADGHWQNSFQLDINKKAISESKKKKKKKDSWTRFKSGLIKRHLKKKESEKLNKKTNKKCLNVLRIAAKAAFLDFEKSRFCKEDEAKSKKKNLKYYRKIC